MLENAKINESILALKGALDLSKWAKNIFHIDIIILLNLKMFGHGLSCIITTSLKIMLKKTSILLHILVICIQ